MLSVDVEKKLGDFALAARFEAERGVTALFGPSGAGKTSLVNMIAGLVTPDRGRIVLDDTVLFDSGAGLNMPTHQRRIGYVFQEGRLFPHMTVARNLDYGRRMQRLAADPRPGGRQEPQHHPRDRRVDAGAIHGQPEEYADDRVHARGPHPEPIQAAHRHDR